ncbi:hypothetical protein BLNAU_21101 [Blattamonas nauphoetae]|uniref:Uncharacterized protein n=1 Tax=Blattamonas nauphoetae TaxID=2049346 RepID=A0ABQ9WWQ2_9EUKA|nr:hypothetical protein BLNAU_21101 [Blattamonas nauphoetae]
MVIKRVPSAFTLLPSPIIPSSSPLQQYSGLSFLAALSKKVRTVFSEFRTHIPIDHQNLSNFIELMNTNPSIVTHSLDFCSRFLNFILFVVKGSPPIKVDNKIVEGFFLFVKDALPTVLSTISSIDILITSLNFITPTSPATPSLSGVETQMTNPLQTLRAKCEDFVAEGWQFFVNFDVPNENPHKSTFQSIVLDDSSFPDLVLQSLKLESRHIRINAIQALIHLSRTFLGMKKRWCSENLVGKMFETVDFVSLPLSDAETHIGLTCFLSQMTSPVEDDEDDEIYEEHLQLARVFVFEPAKKYGNDYISSSIPSISHQDIVTAGLLSVVFAGLKQFS